MTNTTSNMTTEQAQAVLAAEGYSDADVVAAMDSFLEADTRDMDEVGWTAEDVAVLRDQLQSGT